jgi:hypothetical protein
MENKEYVRIVFASVRSVPKRPGKALELAEVSERAS